MKIFTLFSIFVTSLSAFALGPVVISSNEDFQLILRTQAEDPSHLMDSWNQLEQKFQNIYDENVFNKEIPGWEEKRNQDLQKFFTQLPLLKDSILEIYQNAESITQTQFEKFQRFFPDVQDGIPVVFIPSVLSFNGKGVFYPDLKRNALLIGVDRVAERNDDLDTLFSHEFFHVYHFDKLGDAKIWTTMASPIWFEGFATYLSEVMNPTKGDPVILMDPELASACNVESNVKNWAKEYLQFLSMSTEDSQTEGMYKDWFRLSGTTNPKRRGYCVGLHIFRALSHQYSLQEMSSWDEVRFMKATEDALKHLEM